VLRSATVIGAPGEVRRWRFWVLCVNLRWSMYSACTTNSNRHTAEDQRAAISVYYGEALGIENQKKFVLSKPAMLASAAALAAKGAGLGA